MDGVRLDSYCASWPSAASIGSGGRVHLKPVQPFVKLTAEVDSPLELLTSLRSL